jgi:hypothetical protein
LKTIAREKLVKPEKGEVLVLVLSRRGPRLKETAGLPLGVALEW